MSTSVAILSKAKTESFLSGRRGVTDLAVYTEAWTHASDDADVLAAAQGNNPTYDTSTSKWSLASNSELVVFVDKSVSQFSDSIAFIAKKYEEVGGDYDIETLTSTKTVAAQSGTSILINPSGGSTGNVLKKTASGVEWAAESGGEPSAYIKDASVANEKLTLTKKDGTTTVELDVSGKITNPSGGSTGNVLKKTASGVEWAAEATGPSTYLKSASVANEKLTITNQSDGTAAELDISGKLTTPSGGSVGNVLKKTASGTEWAAEATGPSTYLKSASVANEKLTITNQSDGTAAELDVSGKITNPSGGSAGNVLKKTASGVEWGAAPSGEPDAYLKSASVSNGVLTLTKKDDTTVTATAKSLGGVALSGETSQTVEGSLTVGDLYVGGTRVEVVSEMPETPVADTLYFVLDS